MSVVIKVYTIYIKTVLINHVKSLGLFFDWLYFSFVSEELAKFTNSDYKLSLKTRTIVFFIILNLLNTKYMIINCLKCHKTIKNDVKSK